MQVWQCVVFPTALLFAASLFIGTGAQAASNSLPQLYSDPESDPYMELAWEILRRGQLPMFRERDGLQEAYKRGGVDLGIGRGYSGSMAAKHLMGLASANYAGGPGRRRREAPSA